MPPAADHPARSARWRAAPGRRHSPPTVPGSPSRPSWPTGAGASTDTGTTSISTAQELDDLLEHRRQSAGTAGRLHRQGRGPRLRRGRAPRTGPARRRGPPLRRADRSRAGGGRPPALPGGSRHDARVSGPDGRDDVHTPGLHGHDRRRLLRRLRHGTPPGVDERHGGARRPHRRRHRRSRPAAAWPGQAAEPSATRRHRLGRGLVDVPTVPARDPATAIMTEAARSRAAALLRRVQRAGRPQSGRRARAGRGLLPQLRPPLLVRRQAATRADLVAGQYEVAGCLAHGGLGWIYLAKDRKVADRWVVLKGLINTGDEDALAAALAERRFLAQVEHPDIVKIHNFVEHDGDGYIVMEYVNGYSLRSLLEARRAAGRRSPGSAAGRPGHRLHARDPARARAPARSRSPVLRLQAGQRDPDTRVGEAHRPGRRVSHGRRHEPDLRHHRLPGPRDRTHGADRALRPVHGGADADGAVHRLPGLPRARTGTRSRRRPRSPSSSSTTRSTASSSGRPRPIPTPGSRAPTRWRPSSTACSGRSRRRDAGRRPPGASTCFTGETGRAAATAGWRSLPVPLVSPDDPDAAVVVTLGAMEPEAVVDALGQLADRGVEVELRRVRALDRSRPARRGERCTRRDGRRDG